MKTYEVVKPVTIPAAGITDVDGKTIGACIMGNGTICGDPESAEIKSFLENECIKEQSVAAKVTSKVTSRGR